MANLNIPEGYAQIALSLKHDQVLRPAVVTFGIYYNPVEGNLPAATLNAAQVFHAAWEGDIDGNVKLIQASGTVQLESGEYASHIEPMNLAFTSSGEKVSPNVAILLRKATARPGRTGRGRMYLPWAVGDGDVSESGQVSTAAVSAFNSAANDFLANLATTDTPMQLLHGEGAPGGDLPNLVTALTCDSLVATQRRRLRS